MAINSKIVQKINQKAADDPFKRKNILRFLSKVEEGRMPKKELDKIMNEIKCE